MQIEFENHNNGAREYTVNGRQIGVARYDCEKDAFTLHHVSFVNVFPWAVDKNRNGTVEAQTLATIDCIAHAMGTELVALNLA